MELKEEKRIKFPEFKQLIDSFYNDELKRIELSNGEKIQSIEKVNLKPTILYENHTKEIRLEFNIGTEQMYRLKSLSEFYDRIMKNEVFQYGTQLKFVHKKEIFSKDSMELLEFLLRYAEVIKYANSGSYNRFRYYGKGINDDYILINKFRIDEIFDILKGSTVELEKNYVKTSIELIDVEPKIEFSIIKASEEEYLLFPNVEIEKCHIIDGNKYSYLLWNKKLYRCTKEFTSHQLKIIQILKENHQTNMKLGKTELKEFFSLIAPRIKENILYDKDADIEKFIPDKLSVKIYLDSDQDKNIVANIKFKYKQQEFNPLSDMPDIPRDAIEEANVLNYFQQTGFLFDKKRGVLILTDEEKIYKFLIQDLENYKREYEVLVSKDFKDKQIIVPRIKGIGVKIENNLLKIDLDKLNIDKAELKLAIKQYHLKKKYYRLKDGTFIDLYNNYEMNFLDTLVNDMGVSYKELRRWFVQFTYS